MRKTAEDRWWDTYNAALAGLLSRDYVMSGSRAYNEPLGPKAAHEEATDSADLAHGPLLDCQKASPDELAPLRVVLTNADGVPTC